VGVLRLNTGPGSFAFPPTFFQPPKKTVFWAGGLRSTRPTAGTVPILRLSMRSHSQQVLAGEKGGGERPHATNNHSWAGFFVCLMQTGDAQRKNAPQHTPFPHLIFKMGIDDQETNQRNKRCVARSGGLCDPLEEVAVRRGVSSSV